MDTAPYTADESSSIQRVYRYFRTMGLRHLTILNQHHVVTGIITRQDIVEHRLEHHSFDEDGTHFQKYIAVDNSLPRVVYEDKDVIVYSGNLKDPDAVRQSTLAAADRDSNYYSNPFDAARGSTLHTRESITAANIQQEQLLDSSELGKSAMILRQSSYRTRNTDQSGRGHPSVIGRESLNSNAPDSGSVVISSGSGSKEIKAPTNNTATRVIREPKGKGNDNQW